MTVEKKLADALRLVLARDPHNVSDTYLDAREALAAYDRLSYNPGMTVDRLLGMTDQFLSDWEEYSPEDPTLLESKAEWDEWRPRIVACVKACVAIAVLEDTEPHSIDSIIGTAQGALK